MKVLPGAYSGISRFIEIILSVANETYSEEERVYLVKQLSYQLELNGSFMFPFEITITEI
ncbi:hypothetical protein LWM68_33015 [Niabella sp. W65]|nr:hypothetical protein [Niabella sp. W65]MCH7367156.1 hypothetical protein [Niabella sp. W65]